MTKNITKLTSKTQKVNFICSTPYIVGKKSDIKQNELTLPIKKIRLKFKNCFVLIKVRKKFKSMLCTCIVFFYLWMFDVSRQ